MSSIVEDFFRAEAGWTIRKGQPSPPTEPTFPAK